VKDKKARGIHIDGKQLTCPVCEGTQFWTRRTLLNTAGVSFLGFDFLNKTAKNYICSNCNYIYWFYEE